MRTAVYNVDVASALPEIQKKHHVSQTISKFALFQCVLVTAIKSGV